MSFQSIIKKTFLSKETRALSYFDLSNHHGGLNITGRAEFVDYLYATSDDLRDGFVKKIVEEYDKVKNKKKKKED